MQGRGKISSPGWKAKGSYRLTRCGAARFLSRQGRARPCRSAQPAEVLAFMCPPSGRLRVAVAPGRLPRRVGSKAARPWRRLLIEWRAFVFPEGSEPRAPRTQVLFPRAGQRDNITTYQRPPKRWLPPCAREAVDEKNCQRTQPYSSPADLTGSGAGTGVGRARGDKRSLTLSAAGARPYKSSIANP